MRNTYPQPPNTTFYAETLPAPATSSSSSHHHHPQIHPPPSSQSQTLPGAFPTSTATTPISITTTPPININNSYHHQQQQQHHQHQQHQQQQQQHQQLYHHQQQTSSHSTLHHQQQQQNNNHQQQLQQKPHPSSHHQIHLSSHHQPHLTSHHQPHSSPLLQTNHQQHSSPNQHQQKHSSPHPPPLHQPPQLLSDQQSGLPQYTPNSHSHASLNPTHSHASPQPTLSLAPPPPPPITIKQQTTPPLTPYAYDIGGGGGGVKVSSLRQEPKGLLKKEVYEYKAPWPVYGLDWSKLPGEKAFRLAVGSFIEEYSNKLEIISLAEPSTYDDDSYYHRSNIDFVKIAEADHHYPITKVLWEPYKGGSKTSDLLATTGDYLKLWEIVSDEANNGSNTIGYNNNNNHNNNKTVFNKKQQLITKQTLKNKKVDFKAPLTSFDWNQLDSSLAVTSSIDTTCTVWNVETGQAKTQLIAHDKEVYDVAFFTNEVDTFASVGADGSVRLFDLRSLEHSTILYETPPPQPSKTGSSSNSSNQQSPLLRLSFNKISPYYIATFHMNSTEVIILDIRAPGLPVAELNGHNAPVNCVNWSPNSSNILCSGGDDCNAIVWDLGDLSTPNSTISKYNQDPLLAYRATSEVNQLSWNTKYPEWVSIIFGKTIQALKI